MIRFLKISGFSLLGIIALSLLNYLVLDPLIIPDPCYYHAHSTTKLFDLFYEFTASEGYHPSITPFNLILTLFSGAIIGLLLGLKFTKRK